MVKFNYIKEPRFCEAHEKVLRARSIAEIEVKLLAVTARREVVPVPDVEVGLRERDVTEDVLDGSERTADLEGACLAFSYLDVDVFVSRLTGIFRRDVEGAWLEELHVLQDLTALSKLNRVKHLAWLD
mgnify:CR=1 FL=1